MYRYLIILIVLFSCASNIERTYHPNGQLWTISERIDGKHHGDWIQFEENGDTAFVTPYLNGLKHGVSRHYENNKIQSLWSYRLDTGHGEYKNFYPSGALLNRGFKEKGFHVGEWVNYYESGEVQSRSTMKNEKTTNHVEFYKNGQVKFKIDNFKNGIYESFDSLGTKVLESTIISGQLVDTLYQAQ